MEHRSDAAAQRIDSVSPYSRPMAGAGPPGTLPAMTEAAIEFEGLSKRFGKVQAVRDLSFSVQFGRVTGFLGPNGAGKSTTLRTLLGLIHPNSGRATFGGLTYEQLPHPSSHVGAVLEEASFHPGRSGRNHLRVLAAAGTHPESRVGEVLDQVGLIGAADRRVKGYSMGMRQRLAIAAALLGDPDVLILDEPANGLDPPGIRWMRGLLRSEAARGRAVLVSSHLLSEVSQSVDDVVVISHGVLRGSGPLESVLGGADGPVTRVRAADAERLAGLLREDNHFVEPDGSGALLVRGTEPEVVGRVAADHQVALAELVAVSRSLEDVFFELTEEAG
jgi:ABC-2 type transport system ATP-binding protein